MVSTSESIARSVQRSGHSRILGRRDNLWQEVYMPFASSSLRRNFPSVLTWSLKKQSLPTIFSGRQRAGFQENIDLENLIPEKKIITEGANEKFPLRFIGFRNFFFFFLLRLMFTCHFKLTRSIKSMLILASYYVFGNQGLNPTFVVGKSNPMNLPSQNLIKEHHPFLKNTEKTLQSTAQRGVRPSTLP